MRFLFRLWRLRGVWKDGLDYEGRKRRCDAAKQFEALLIGQMLRSARQSGSGWLGSEDSSGECATDYAEQQFAAILARNGGLGLAGLITKGLEK